MTTTEDHPQPPTTLPELAAHCLRQASGWCQAAEQLRRSPGHSAELRQRHAADALSTAADWEALADLAEAAVFADDPAAMAAAVERLVAVLEPAP